MARPSTTSKRSISASCAASAGRYQPSGGGRRRWRRRAPGTPRRARRHHMVRTEGSDESPRGQRTEHHRRTRFTQIALLLQLLSNAPHQFFQELCGPLHVVRTRRVLAPIDTVEAVTLRPLHPALHGGQAHMKPTGDRAHRYLPSHQSDHGATSLGPGPALAMSRPPSVTVFHPCTDTEVLAPG
jgi:hypothetical protein